LEFHRSANHRAIRVLELAVDWSTLAVRTGQDCHMPAVKCDRFDDTSAFEMPIGGGRTARRDQIALIA
jgi:hypothetical protein